MPSRLGLFIAVLILLPPCALADKLGPENLLLLVNKNVPDGQRLAEFYKNARGVPDGRILALDLTARDETSQNYFDSHVVPTVRDYLRKNGLEEQVTCVVTFYGIPLRLSPRVPNAAEQREVTYLKGELKRVLDQSRAELAKLEADARAIDPQFTSGTGPEGDVDVLTARSEATLRFLASNLSKVQDAEAQAKRVNALVDATRLLGGPAAVIRMFSVAPGQTAEDLVRLGELARGVNQAAQDMQQLAEARHDPIARQRARSLSAASFGALGVARTLQAHVDYLAAAEPTAAFDSELSLLWWNQYARHRWRPNLLHYRTLAAQEVSPHKAPRTLMVMRLDAPWPGMVREMILASLKAERNGLVGRVVLDSRGIHSDAEAKNPGAYAWYDQSIRNLAEIVRTKTKLPMLHDESPGVIAPNTAQNVALYCGWYSVRQYVPGSRFVPGAVGFHVASYELVSLRAEDERGWVKGLITDGVAATSGAVAEPYLHAFPLADDFFPLLLTGKLPLAEVYWRTTPLTSWMIAMIGDPLYTPFQANPQLAVEDLPARLRVLFDTPTTRPTTLPTRP